MSPETDRASRRARARPSPADGAAASPALPRTAGSKIVSASSAPTPGPSSSTVKSTAPSARASERETAFRPYRQALSTHRMEDALGEVGVDADRVTHARLSSTVSSIPRSSATGRHASAAACATSTPSETPRGPASCCAAASSASTMRAIWRALPRISVSASRYSSGVARPPQRELGLGRHLRERRAQLVRELGREAALVTQARGDPVEQAVERRRRAASARRAARRGRSAGRGRARSTPRPAPSSAATGRSAERSSHAAAVPAISRTVTRRASDAKSAERRACS